ncbi:hypothetical protein BHU72_12550 [Desulfuribacillus stibiiarsenatis]|uniref:Putative manganese efflux pump MntP n=1 Tax=Desulfuribacillus stibiiarsenatis TaxID=1390249 RepID=A0A1E5L271_9FIRM|nr:manganese efflux pump MntP family protein [Desulfuribacillus stibiiarsenatis]OEH84227.1 hypothetical protein BHU72_12550 [Desulfuribacillus stibiiarsenatis]
MSILTIFLVAFALGIDAFSVCIGIGLCGIKRRQIFIVSITVAIFHIFMPLAGMILGQVVGEYIGAVASVFGAIVLLVIGFYYIYTYIMETIRSRKDRDCAQISAEVCTEASLLNKPFGLFILAGSVSIDALAVGFGLGALGMDLILTVLIMGIVAGIMTYAGLILGKRLGSSVGEKAELIGGILLVGIAIYLLLTK